MGPDLKEDQKEKVISRLRENINAVVADDREIPGPSQPKVTTVSGSYLYENSSRYFTQFSVPSYVTNLCYNKLVNLPTIIVHQQNLKI